MNNEHTFYHMNILFSHDMVHICVVTNRWFSSIQIKQSSLWLIVELELNWNPAIHDQMICYGLVAKQIFSCNWGSINHWVPSIRHSLYNNPLYRFIIRENFIEEYLILYSYILVPIHKIVCELLMCAGNGKLSVWIHLV